MSAGPNNNAKPVVIDPSPGELAPVLDAILAEALPLREAAFGAIMTYDGRLIQGVAVRGAPEPIERLLRQPRPPSPFTTERLLRGERFVDIADAAQLPRSAENRGLEAFIDFSGARTMLYLPVRRERRFLGVTAAYRRHVRPFSEQQIELLEGYAGGSPPHSKPPADPEPPTIAVPIRQSGAGIKNSGSDANWRRSGLATSKPRDPPGRTEYRCSTASSMICACRLPSAAPGQ